MYDRSIPFCNLILRCDRVLPQEVDVPKGYAIRPWQPGDEEAWARLHLQLQDFATHEEALAYFRGKYLQDEAWAAARVFFAISPEGEAVGTVTCGEDLKDGKPVHSLHWMVVQPEHQRKGLGRALGRKALQVFRRMDNAAPVYIHTQPWSWKAVLLYVSLGFTLQRRDAFADYVNQYDEAMAALAPLLSADQLALLQKNSSADAAGCDLSAIRYDEKGLVPAIAQDAATGEVLMLAYMNAESLQATLKSGYATYFSRSRQSLWLKGETSGHLQKIVSIHYDCDGDAILLTVEQTGPACHTGKKTCFHNPLHVAGAKPASSAILEKIYETVADRAAHPRPGSYTNYLLGKGAEKICKKVGEEATETVIAAMKNDPNDVALEAADLLYHLTVLLYQQGVTMQDVFGVLEQRH